MKQAVIDSYEKKVCQLVDCCVCVQQSYEIEIKEKNRDNPIYGEFWRRGGYNGALTYFLRTLTEEEKEISGLVFARIQREKDDSDTVSVEDYINVALEVLKALSHSSGLKGG